MENEYKVSGYIFTNIQIYKEAKREAETVDYIRANTDLNDMNKVLKLYHKLVERKTLKTIIGYEFLKEIQEKILKEGIISRENLPFIQVELESKQYQSYSNKFDHDMEQKNNSLAEEYRIRHRNSRIINVFLVIIIIIMFIMSFIRGLNSSQVDESSIIDKYSAWEEDLNAREKALEEREILQPQE